MNSNNVCAYVLHQRPYRETSAIVDFITDDDHHIRAVCKGVRGTGRQAIQRRAALQPFVELAIIFAGRTDLKSLHSLESTGIHYRITGRALYAGMYLNELVVRLCSLEGIASGVYASYSRALNSLFKLTAFSSAAELGIILRQFEFALLNTVGYGYDWQYDGLSGQRIEKEAFYRLDPESGFVKTPKAIRESNLSTEAIPGNVLLAIAAGDYSDGDVNVYAKLIARQSLRPLLGEKPLKSRELYLHRADF